jgi:hypothetical protein
VRHHRQDREIRVETLQAKEVLERLAKRIGEIGRSST